MGSFDIASTSGNSHLALNVNSNELGIQPHTYFNLYLGHAYTSSSRTFHNDDRTMLIDSLKKVSLYGDIITSADEPAITIQNTGTSGNDTTKLNYCDLHGQIHAQLRTQLKDDSSGGSYDSAFHIKTAVNGTLATRIAIKEDGLVGIGTENPVSPLQVGTATGSDPTTTGNIMSISANRAFTSGYSGQLLVQPSDYGQDYGGMITFGMHRASSLASPLPVCAIAGRKEEGTSGNYSAYLHFGTRANGGNITEKMRITSDGKVGIGTDTPSNYYDTTLALYKATSNYFTIASSDAGTTSILFADGTSGDAMYRGQIEYAHASDELRIHTNASRAITIDSSQNVGIGTTTPGTILHLSENTNSNLEIDGSTAGEFRLMSMNDARNAYEDFKIYGDDVNLNANSAGQCGIGGISGAFKLHILGSDDHEGLYIKTGNSSGDWLVRAEDFAGNSRFVVKSTGESYFNGGNVGIGDTSPSYKLEVAGTFYASGSSQAFKKNVTDLAVDSSAIYNLNPVSYNYKKDYENFGYDLAEGKQFGLISEQVAEAVPELAIMKDGEPKNVDYQKLSVLLLAEMQKMNKRVKELENA